MPEIIEIYKMLLNHLNDGVYFVDNGRKILFWNSAAEKITGYTKDEIIGSYCWNNFMSHIDENGNELCTIGCPLEKTTLDGQYREETMYLRHKDGFRIPVLVKAVPIFDNRGIINGAIEIFTNISSYEKILNRINIMKEMEIIDKNLELPNSSYMENIVNSKIAYYNKNNNSNCFVLFEIDNWSESKIKKEVSDIVTKTILYNISEKEIIGYWKEGMYLGIFEDCDINKTFNEINKLKNLIKKSEIRIGNEILNVTISSAITRIRNDDTLKIIDDRLRYLLKISKNGGNDRISID